MEERVYDKNVIFFPGKEIEHNFSFIFPLLSALHHLRILLLSRFLQQTLNEFAGRQEQRRGF